MRREGRMCSGSQVDDLTDPLPPESEKCLAGLPLMSTMRPATCESAPSRSINQTARASPQHHLESRQRLNNTVSVATAEELFEADISFVHARYFHAWRGHELVLQLHDNSEGQLRFALCGSCHFRPMPRRPSPTHLVFILGIHNRCPLKGASGAVRSRRGHSKQGRGAQHCKKAVRAKACLHWKRNVERERV